jgi:hypothetical protein
MGVKIRLHMLSSVFLQSIGMGGLLYFSAVLLLGRLLLLPPLLRSYWLFLSGSVWHSHTLENVRLPMVLLVKVN